MNDYQFKIAKFKGEFVWHDHKDTDEVFFVVQGSMSIEFEDHTLQLNEGEMYVVAQKVFSTNLLPQTNAMFCWWNQEGLSTQAKVT